MASLADLHRAVQTTLAGGRLGKPVFVRYFLQYPGEPDTLLPRLAQAAASARTWLGQSLERVYALGTQASGQASVTLQFREGGTALILCARCEPRGEGVDLLVLGSKGALYHAADSADLWEEQASNPAEPVDRTIRTAIESALRSGQPELVVRGAPS
jgi:hypothetical protein